MVTVANLAYHARESCWEQIQEFSSQGEILFFPSFLSFLSIASIGKDREGNGYPLQYSCPGNPKTEVAWRAAVHGSQRVRHDWGDLAGTQDHILFERNLRHHSGCSQLGEVSLVTQHELSRGQWAWPLHTVWAEHWLSTLGPDGSWWVPQKPTFKTILLSSITSALFGDHM